MVVAREAFLEAGHFAPIADAVADAAQQAADRGARLVADLGCGTGFYLRRVMRELPGWGAIALDASPYALTRAKRAGRRVAAVRANLWCEIPVRCDAVGVAISAFAPRNGREIARILSPNGALVLVTPTAGHLAELRPKLAMLTVDPAKEVRLHQELAPYLGCETSIPVEFEMALQPGDIESLVAMGPSAHHMDAADLQARIARLPEGLQVTASVLVRTFRPSVAPGM